MSAWGVGPERPPRQSPAAVGGPGREPQFLLGVADDGAVYTAREMFREVSRLKSLTDAQVETIATNLIRIIALEAEIRALQARGNVLAAAVEAADDAWHRPTGQLLVMPSELYEPWRRACEAARAWRVARGNQDG